MVLSTKPQPLDLRRDLTRPRRSCPAYLKAKEHSIVLVTEACLVADNVSTWILDSAATNHICCSLTGFKKTKSLEEGEFCFKWGDGSLVSAKGCGIRDAVF